MINDMSGTISKEDNSETRKIYNINKGVRSVYRLSYTLFYCVIIAFV